MKKLNLKVVLAASALVAALTAGGIYAYLTYTQSVTNTFTVGNVAATLTEPSWTGAEEGAHDDIYPGQSFDKDPTITIGNDSNDAVVFMEAKDLVASRRDLILYIKKKQYDTIP